MSLSFPHTSCLPQTCVAYAKGSQARQIIRGEQLKITKTSETLAAVDEVQKRCDEIQESNAKIMVCIVCVCVCVCVRAFVCVRV
jgi:hypothetical protein